MLRASVCCAATCRFFEFTTQSLDAWSLVRRLGVGPVIGMRDISTTGKHYELERSSRHEINFLYSTAFTSIRENDSVDGIRRIDRDASGVLTLVLLAGTAWFLVRPGRSLRLVRR